MKEVKKLFRINGLTTWLDRRDERNFMKINEYVWAENPKRAEILIKFRIASLLKKTLNLDFLPRISLDFCTIELVKIPKEKNQLKLTFKKFFQIKKQGSRG